MLSLENSEYAGEVVKAKEKVTAPSYVVNDIQTVWLGIIQIVTMAIKIIIIYFLKKINDSM